MSRYLSDEELEERVREVRRRLGLEYQTRPDVMTIINKLKAASVGFDYHRVQDDEMPEAEAQWDSVRNLMRIRESVFRAAQRGEVRARMTVAHEMGHYFLGHGGVRNRSFVKTAAERFVSEVRREEAEARRFAAMFLAPSYLIDACDSPDDIRVRFGMSLEAAAIRRDESNGIERRAAGLRRELPSVVIDYLREAKRRGQTVRTDIGE